MFLRRPSPDALTRAFFKIAPVGLGLIDEELRFIAVNDTLAAINGIPPEEHEGRPVAEVIPGLASQLEVLHARALAGEPVVEVEVRGETAAAPGVERRWLVSYDLVEDRGQRAVGVSVVDVTERIHAERALRESEDRFRSVFEHALIGMDVVNGHGRFVRANRAMCDLLGRTEQELREIDFHELTYPDDRERSRAAFERLLRGEVDHYDIEKRYLLPDGETLWGRIMVAGVRDEHRRLRLIVSQLLDLSAQRRADERVRTSEAQLARAQRIAQIGSWETTVGPPYEILWSDEMYRQIGYEPGEVEPGAELFMERVHPDDREALRGHARAAQAAGTPMEWEYRIVRPEGGVRTFELVGEPIQNEQGEVVRYVGTTHDVTDERRRDAERAAVAELGRHALEGRSVTRLCDETVEVCARVLEVGQGGVAAVLADGRLRLVAGVGVGDVAALPVLPPGNGSYSGYVIEAGEPVVVTDWLEEDRFPRLLNLPGPAPRSAIAVPIPTAAGPFGVLVMNSPEPGRFVADDLEFLQGMARALGMAIERKRAEDRIAGLAEARGRLVAQTLDAEDETRRQISEMLHDHALQELLAARQDLAEVCAGEARAAEYAGRAREGIERAVRQLREAVADLHPVVLEHGGLASAVTAVAEHQARRGGFEYDVAVEPEAAGVHDRLVLSLARELLANAAKHAEASTVRVRVNRAEGGVVLEVEDDGRGFDPGALDRAVLEGHIGLASHAERVDAVGGRLEARAEPGRGARMRAIIPART